MRSIKLGGRDGAVRRFNARDVLVVAVMQAAAIAVGVLLVGRWDKRFLNSGMQAPFPVAELADYGLLSLAIPLAWILLTLRARLSPRVAESAKRRAFVGGLVFVLAITLLFGGTVVRAWLVYDHTIDLILDE